MKTILITGSTDGIGKLAAMKLAKEGNELILHGRNENKLNDAVEEIKTETKNDKISGFVADFSDLDAVLEMANRTKQNVSKIDILINNAGVFKSKKTYNKNGLDMRFVVNYFASYLLTKELIPLLEKGNEARIINLSSAAQASVSVNAMNGKTELPEQQSYAQSKLALTMWSFHLAAELPKITVIPVNPGSLLNTNMAIEAYGKFWSSADKGANILYDLAIGEDYKSHSGAYFDNDKESFGKAHPDAYQEDEIRKLIIETEKLITKLVN